MKVIKKLFLLFFIIVLCFFACIYIFIPHELDISVAETVKCNSSSAFRGMQDETSWKKLWPQARAGQYTYRLGGKAYPELEIRLDGRGISFPGRVSVAPIDRQDSSILLWKSGVVTGYNPWRKLVTWREARSVRAVMEATMDSLRSFLEKKENIYGMDIREFMSNDSVVVVVEKDMPSYPPTGSIYGVIHAIRAFIVKEGIREVNYPMLNVKREENGQYHCMIAIPVDRRTMGEGEFGFRRFVPWKMVGGEVRGGAGRAEAAMGQLMLYVSDRQYTLMAIPFQSLVTERDTEKDSSLWRTRVAVPIP